MLRPSACLLALVCSIVAPSAGCGRGDSSPRVEETPPASTVQGRVVVVSWRDEGALQPALALIDARLPGVTLVIESAPSGPPVDRLRAEREAPTVDLVFSDSAIDLEAATAEGLFAPLPESILSRVPERFRGSSGGWVGLGARAQVVVARRILGNKPLSLLDLGDLRWTGRVARTGGADPAFVDAVCTALLDHGRTRTLRFLDGLAANTEDGSRVFPDRARTVAAVFDGRAELALADHTDYYRAVLGATGQPDHSAAADEQRVAESAVEVVFPDRDDKGVPWSLTGGALVAGGPGRDAAIAVLELLLTAEGQRAWTAADRSYPVVDKVPSPAGVAPVDSFVWSEPGAPRLTAARAAASELIASVGLD